jgi:hypothetical protein
MSVIYWKIHHHPWGEGDISRCFGGHKNMKREKSKRGKCKRNGRGKKKKIGVIG